MNTVNDPDNGKTAPVPELQTVNSIDQQCFDGKTLRQQAEALQLALQNLLDVLDDTRPICANRNARANRYLNSIEENQYLLTRTARRLTGLAVKENGDDQLRMAALRLCTILGLSKEAEFVTRTKISSAVFQLGTMRSSTPSQRITAWRQIMEYANSTGIAAGALVDIDALLACEESYVRQRLPAILGLSAKTPRS